MDEGVAILARRETKMLTAAIWSSFCGMWPSWLQAGDQVEHPDQGLHLHRKQVLVLIRVIFSSTYIGSAVRLRMGVRADYSDIVGHLQHLKLVAVSA